MAILRIEAIIVKGADLALLQEALSEMKGIGLLSDAFLEVPLVAETFDPVAATKVAMITADRGYIEAQELAQFLGSGVPGLKLLRIDDVTPVGPWRPGVTAESYPEFG